MFVRLSAYSAYDLVGLVMRFNQKLLCFPTFEIFKRIYDDIIICLDTFFMYAFVGLVVNLFLIISLFSIIWFLIFKSLKPSFISYQN